MFWKSILSKFSFAKTQRNVRKYRRLRLEVLEDRLAPATFSQNGTVITLTLNSLNEAVQIHASSANHYALSSTANFTGNVNAPSSVSGTGTTSATLVTSGVTQISMVDAGFGGASVTFTDSTASYAEFMVVSLTNSGAGPIEFQGASTFDGNLTANTTNNITFDLGSAVTMNGTGNVQAQGANTTVAFNGNLVVNSVNLKVKAGQTISQGPGVLNTASTTVATFTLTGAAGDILLGGPNDMGGSVTFGQTSPGSVRDVVLRNVNSAAQVPTLGASVLLRHYVLTFDNSSILLPAGLHVTGDLSVTAGGGIGEAGPITAGGSADFTILSNGSIQLDAFTNNSVGGTVSFSTSKCNNTTRVGYEGAGPVILGTSSLGLGKFTITANGNITQNGAVIQKRGAAAFTFNLAGSSRTVLLNNSANDIEGFLAILGASTVSLTNTSTLAEFPDFGGGPVANVTLILPNAPAVLPDVNLVNLTVNSQGIYQAPGTTLHVSSDADFNANNNPLVLTNVGNDFTNVRLNNAGPNRVAITDVNALNFAVGNSDLGSGPFTVAAGGAITQSAGAITQSSAAARASFTAGAGSAITVNQANDIRGVTTFHTTGAGGNVSITNSPLTLGTSIIGGNLTVTSGVTQDPTSTLTVNGNTKVGVTNSTCTLDNLGNVFVGSVAFTGNFASVRTGGSLLLGASFVVGSFTVHAGGTITQNDAIFASGGNDLFDAGTAAITLTNPSNIFGTVSATSTGSAPVAINAAGGSLSIDRLKLGSGVLTITCSGQLLQNSDAGGITQTAATPLIFDTSNVIHLTASTNKFLGAISLPSGGKELRIHNQGDLSFVGTPALSGFVVLNAGGLLTLPDEPLANVANLDCTGHRTVVGQNITATGSIQFKGNTSFVTPGITLDSPSIFFRGDVNPAGALTINLGANGVLTHVGGTWNQGANPLTINGGGVFNIGDAFPGDNLLTTFSMVSGTIAMPNAANLVVNENATFKVGGTSNPDTVTVDNNGGSVTFQDFSTLSVGLGATNDKLGKAAGDSGNIFLHSRAKLTSYAGLAGAAPTPVLVAGAGVIDTTNGFFNRTVDVFSGNGNAPHVFLMGTDIVQPTYTPNQLSIASGGTLAANGIATGIEVDSDKFTLQAVKTGTTIGVPLVFDVNVDNQVDVVIRNAAAATTLTVITTKNFGNGLTQLGGIAVNGPGTVVIKAPTSNTNADILIAGPLAALTLRDVTASGGNFSTAVIRAGGTSAGATTITGRNFINISIDLPTVLSSLAVNEYAQKNSSAENYISAERFGTIKSTPIPAAGLHGDFVVPRLTNLNRVNSTLPAITSVTVGGILSSGNSNAWDIAGNITSITAAATADWELGVADANARNSGKLNNIGILSLGSVDQSNVIAAGKISNLSATNWVIGTLEAGAFGNIKIVGNGTVGNLGDFSHISLTATGNSGLSTVAGVPSFEAISSLSVAGDSSNVTIHLLDGNATSMAALRVAESWTVAADVTPHGGAIGKLTAAAFDNLVIDAKSAGAIAAVGNASANLPGNFNGSVVLHGTPGFTGVSLGALKVTNNLQDSTILVENGSIGTITVGRSVGGVDIRAVGAAGAINSITAPEWIASVSDNLVARNIGTLSITGAPMTAPGGFLVGDFTKVNVVTFLSGGTTPAIGSLTIAGNYNFATDGFLRADNGITTFKVGRAVVGDDAGRPVVALLNSSTLSDVPGRIANLTVGTWLSVDIAAKTLGAVKAVGFAKPEIPEQIFTQGFFGGSGISLFGVTSALLTPHVGLDSLTAKDVVNVNLLAPFGITSLVMTGIFDANTLNTDNPPAGTAGRIGTLQALAIGNNFIRAVSIGTLRQTSSALSFHTTDVTVTGFTGPATAPVAIGTLAIAGRIEPSTFNVPHSITNLVVGGSLVGSELAVGFADNSRIANLSVGQFRSNLTARNIGVFTVTGDVTSALITLTGNNAGVALGSFTATGPVTSSTFNVTGGNVTSFIVGAFISSRLLVGVHLPSPGDIGHATGQSDWLGGSAFTLGTFRTTGLFDPNNIAATASYRDSFVVAQKLGTIAIAGLDPNVPFFSTSVRFGIAFRASRGAGPLIKVNGLDKPIEFTVGDFLYTELNG